MGVSENSGPQPHLQRFLCTESGECRECEEENETVEHLICQYRGTDLYYHLPNHNIVIQRHVKTMTESQKGIDENIHPGRLNVFTNSQSAIRTIESVKDGIILHEGGLKILEQKQVAYHTL